MTGRLRELGGKRKGRPSGDSQESEDADLDALLAPENGTKQSKHKRKKDLKTARKKGKRSVKTELYSLLLINGAPLTYGH